MSPFQNFQKKKKNNATILSTRNIPYTGGRRAFVVCRMEGASAQQQIEAALVDTEVSQGHQEDEVPTTLQAEELTCSLYISRAGNSPNSQNSQSGSELAKVVLEDAIRMADPSAGWQVSETSCGLIAAFARETDADKLLQRGDLARIFEGPVQVARFSARDSRYHQAVLLRDVPWAIPLQDLSSALSKQGIAAGSVERSRQYIRVEVLNAGHYELLLRQGLDFFGAARFSAVPERWWRNGGSVGGGPSQAVIGGTAAGCNGGELPPAQQGDGVLQCYRCQGFWHVAANCRHLPRCVRCGEPHSVEFCPRPRSNPVCCHCAGPHHAGFRQCPVRLQLLNATPISITLSTTRAGGQYGLQAVSKASLPQEQQSQSQVAPSP
ncbi:uncharacterized protein LOC124303708 isoform X2 [Neodiprion virginianus]|uniref:uncharacterized protein LOC124303708 isoform X2 n=1 Tax=Neodiprion virginianus TaxID=2961670 RepID=UPI001EE6FF86|nr:uncharacterized protein LOC124303708 isoform X2 [Neodiprion virginianus]